MEKNNILCRKRVIEQESWEKAATEPVLLRHGAEETGLREGALLVPFPRRFQ